MVALWLGLLGCGPRRAAAPAAGAAAAEACTLRLATLPNSTWRHEDTVLRVASDTVRYSRGELSRLYACTPDTDAQVLRCATTPDVLSWCRARLANRRACDRALLAAYAPRLSEAQISDAIVEAAEEHAALAGTEQEGYFTERYASPERAMLHTLLLRPDPQTCQITAQETAVRLVGGEWDEQAAPTVSFVPVVP